MSWIDKLYRTYEKNIGAVEANGDDSILLPICHSTQNAHIEITIDHEGNFRRAEVVSKDNASTIVPCTEKSASRAGSKPVHHPLADKLQYLAGDFVEFGGEVTSGFAKIPEQPFENYMGDLKSWCESDHAHWKAQSIFQYLENKRVVCDLVKEKVLHLDDSDQRSGLLFYDWETEKKRPVNYSECTKEEQKKIDRELEEKKPRIFSLLTGKVDKKGKRAPWQAEAFIRWRVEKKGVLDSSTQTDCDLQKAWVSYYSSQNQAENLCLISGEKMVLAESHPAKIRNSGDKAKLVSSNDSSGFTYRGRFTDASQVCGVGFETSQKAYNALRWLIARQGWRSGSQAIVSWAVSGAEIPSALDNTNTLFGNDEGEPPVADTAQSFGTALTKRIAGYSVKLGKTNEVVVMGLDSATPGRMAITYYRELTGSEFLSRIDSWHRNCCWFQNFSKEKKFIGAPSPNDIAKAAYGNEVDDKLKRATISRLLPCIIDGFSFPKDLVESCFHNSVRRHAFDHWEWGKILGITCALYKYYNKEKEYTMALDRERKTRDYLYGRLLAVGDGIEGFALGLAGEKRPTNAARLTQRFADYPCSTWRTIELALMPYKARLGGRIKKYKTEQDEIMNLFDSNEFADDKIPLTGEFLLGFHCQRTVLMKSENNNNEGEEDESNEQD